MLKHFDFKSLSEIDDGRIAKTIDHALVRIYDDLADRPSNDKARTITLQIALVPLADKENGRLDDVDVALKIVEKVPARESKVYRMTAQNGVLLYNELSPDDPDQATLDGLGTVTNLRRAKG